MASSSFARFGSSLPALCALLFLLVSLGRAQPAATAALEGRVKNVATGESLENARVSLKGTTVYALTDASGAYQLTGLPAGAVTLRVFFTGLDEQELTVALTSGRTTQRDVQLGSQAKYGKVDDTVKLDQFVVQAARETLRVTEQQVLLNAATAPTTRTRPHIQRVV